MYNIELLLAKDAIRDRLFAHYHALDRIKYDPAETVFTPEAQVNYGPTYVGDAHSFVKMMLKQHRQMISAHHVVSNVIIKVSADGTKAASESYIHAAAKYRDKKGKPSFTVESRLRMFDKWVKIDGKWFIFESMLAGDNTFMVPTPTYFEDYNNGVDKAPDPSEEFFAGI